MEDRKGMPEAGSRRDVIKKMAYAAPAVLSLAATPAFASNGSSPPPPCDRPARPKKIGSQYINN